MNIKGWTVLAACALALLLGGQTGAAAQGRGGGRGGAGGGGMGRGGGPPAGVGVDRGIGRSSDSSMGRSDAGRGNASDRSNGRYDAGIERARLRRENSNSAERELREHPEMAPRLHTTARDLRAGYEAALVTNPELKFG